LSGEPSRTGRSRVMARKRDEGMPALQNDEVTGMTEKKQEEIVRRSGRASRKDAAKEFYEEEGDQARKTPASGRDSEQ
jgi:hypothetical protein